MKSTLLTLTAVLSNKDYFDDVCSHNGTRQHYRGCCTDVFFNDRDGKELCGYHAYVRRK